MQEPVDMINLILVDAVCATKNSSCLRFYKREATLHSNPCSSQRSADSACRDMVMAYVGSILLAFLAFGYMTSAAPKLPFDSYLEEYPEDTPPLNDESSFQHFMTTRRNSHRKVPA